MRSGGITALCCGFPAGRGLCVTGSGRQVSGLRSVRRVLVAENFQACNFPSSRPPGHLPVGWGVDFAPGGSPKVGASELNRGPCDDGRRTPPRGPVRDGDGAALWGSYLVERGSLSRMRGLHDEQQGRDTA